MKIISKTLLASLLIFGLAACGGDDDDDPTSSPTPTPEPQTIVDVAVEAGTFTTLVAALEATELDAVLDDPDATFTVFAPTDAAFDLLGAETISALLADTDTLSNILLYHVISGSEVNAAAAISAAGSTVEMANGDSIGLWLDGEMLNVNLSTVTTTNIMADNGIIHVIDAVLMPPADVGEPTMNIVETAVANEDFETLVAAVTAAGLVDTLSNEEATFTVFAPTDAAFERLGAANVEALLQDTDLLTEILTQHVVAASVNVPTAYSLIGSNATTVSGNEIAISLTGENTLRFGGAEIEITDIHTTNGIIHVIDTVVIGDAGLPQPMENIAEVATAAGSFTTLLTALEATGLDTVLANNEAEFTVFAPTDAAFEALGQSTIDGLLANTDALTQILLYHVVSGATVLADAAGTVAASDNPFVTTANANMDRAALSFEDDNLVINLSNITAANVMASNGVIHVIDKVMLPPEVGETPTMTIAEIASGSEIFTTLTAALQAASLVDALNDESATFTVFAPTDDAFALIPEADLNALLADTDALSAVLGLHVISGAAVDSVTAYSLNGKTASTLFGDNIAINVVDGMLEVQGSTVTTVDIQATNGVIHVIDAVITEAAE